MIDYAKTSDRFVAYVYRNKADKGKNASFKRADNPSTEQECWGELARFGVNLTNESERLPFALIGAIIAKGKGKESGEITFGSALYCAFGKDKTAAATARLRRLLSCDDVEEVFLVMRGILRLIQSRVSFELDYSQLLQDLLWFNHNPQRVKARWAQDFYNKPTEEEAELCI